MTATPFEKSDQFVKGLAYSFLIDEAMTEYKRVSELYEKGVIRKQEYDLVVNTLIATLQCINPDKPIEA